MIVVQLSGQEPEDELAFQLDLAGIRYERQYTGYRPRRLKADFFIPPDLLVEVEGGVFTGGIGHNSVKGILRDMDKANLAVLNGLRLLRVHSDHIKDGEALRMIEEALR